MSHPVDSLKTDKLFFTAFLMIAALGIYLRLDQFTQQVLLDDEWHVIHQLIARTPAELLTTLGIADFSIPLALLYWLEAQWFGLSETAMRWPMMLAGILFLCLAPLYVRRHMDARAALVFMLLLALSPRLITYSQTARPYALTLLLSLLALVIFDKFVVEKSATFRWGVLYVFCALASAWLHLVTLPMVIAPFAVHGVPALISGDKRQVIRLLKLGLVTLAGVLVFLLPPLLANPGDLAIKLGEHRPALSALYGMLFVWVGSGSALVVLAGSVLALFGVSSAWRHLPIIPGILMGLALTLGLILMTEPAWVQYALTLARYLLAALPLFLFFIACGVLRLNDGLVRQWGLAGKSVSIVLFSAMLVFWLVESPLPKLISRPNSNGLHAAYQFDYREDHNLVLQYQDGFPLSPFWTMLGRHPADSLRLVVAPFSFESHNWDAARWEQKSRQRVMPGFLTGLCGGHRWGEVPANERFRFKNGGHLADSAKLKSEEFDVLVFQKIARFAANVDYDGKLATAVDCESKIRTIYGEPVFEDDWITVFPLSENARDVMDAGR